MVNGSFTFGNLFPHLFGIIHLPFFFAGMPSVLYLSPFLSIEIVDGGPWQYGLNTTRSVRIDVTFPQSWKSQRPRIYLISVLLIT